MNGFTPSGGLTIGVVGAGLPYGARAGGRKAAARRTSTGECMPPRSLGASTTVLSSWRL